MLYKMSTEKSPYCTQHPHHKIAMLYKTSKKNIKLGNFSFCTIYITSRFWGMKKLLIEIYDVAKLGAMVSSLLCRYLQSTCYLILVSTVRENSPGGVTGGRSHLCFLVTTVSLHNPTLPGVLCEQ
jgi:hypothetical protein